MDNINYLNIYNYINLEEKNEVIEGLVNVGQKRLDSKFFYDDYGSTCN